MTDILAPFAYLLGKPSADAKVKAQAQDFQVIEDLGYEFTGEGEHFMVKIRKQGENTTYVANELAKACGVQSKNVSWAGLKDRHAVTEQWLSVHLPKQGDELDIAEFEAQHPQVKIVETARHNKKLRPGDLKGNKFTIRLVDVTDIQDVEARLAKIQSLGVPNYFGAQRFGKEGSNLSEARRWGRDNVRTRNQNKRSLYLSTARSWIFNHIVSHRIESECFNLLLDGDLVQDTNGELVLVDESNKQDLQKLITDGKRLLTASLAGDNALPTQGEAEQLENKFLDAEPDLMKLIRGNRMRHDRRPVALYANDMAWNVENNDVVVSFSLPAGSFATSILREVVNEIAIERVYD